MQATVTVEREIQQHAVSSSSSFPSTCTPSLFEQNWKAAHFHLKVLIGLRMKLLGSSHPYTQKAQEHLKQCKAEIHKAFASVQGGIMAANDSLLTQILSNSILSLQRALDRILAIVFHAVHYQKFNIN